MEKFVKNVMTNVKHVHLTKTVSYVPVTELMIQNVNVQQELIILVKLFVHLVITNVKNVKIRKTTVLNVMVSEILKKNVIVQLDIMKMPRPKNVNNVAINVILVKIVPNLAQNVLEIDQKNQIVIAQQDIGMMENLLFARNVAINV